MKNILLMLLSLSILSFAYPSHADLPANDPVVQQIRNQFAAGKAPVLQELKLGREWSCLHFEAFAGGKSSSVPQLLFNFQKLDAFGFLLSNTGTQAKVTSYTYTNVDLVGVAQLDGDTYKSVIRTLDGQTIISEWSTNSTIEIQTVPAIADPGFRTVSYAICKPL